MVFGRAKPRAPKPVFTGGRGRFVEAATGIVVGLGATPELETVCFSFRDPEYQSGRLVKFFASTLFVQAAGGRACGFDARIDLGFEAYLRETDRSMETLRAYLAPALTAIAVEEFRIEPDAVVLRLRPDAKPTEEDAVVSPVPPALLAQAPTEVSVGANRAELPSENGGGAGDGSADLGAMLREITALDATIPGKSHLFWGGGSQHPNGFHLENWEAAALVKAKQPQFITVDETPMGVRLDSLTMRDGANAHRFLSAVDAMARKLGPIQDLGLYSFTARIANVLWRAALLRFAQEARGHIYVFSDGARENAAILKTAMPELAKRVNAGFVTAINNGVLPVRPPGTPDVGNG